jgi:aldose 1-epimerase
MLALTTAPTIEGYETLVLRSAEARLEAAFVPRAGNVLASLRDGGEELLGQRGGVAQYAGGMTTMGVPLLHPWANRLAGDSYVAAGRRVTLGGLAVQRDEHGLPIHGVANGIPWWDVRRLDAGALRASLAFGARPELLAAFPFPHRLTVDAALTGRTLALRTTLQPTGALAVPIAFGFHPYLRLPGVPRRDWHVELPALERLELDDRGLPTGRSEPVGAWAGLLGDRVFDHAYRSAGPGTTFAVSGGGRRIELRFDDGFPLAQVFAPADDDVICFEPMTAPTNALITGDGLTLVGPTDVYSAAFSITVASGLTAA